MLSEKGVGRVTVYRRALAVLADAGGREVHSRELAAAAGTSAVQVRRDLLALGATGSARHGYDIATLLDGIERFLGTALDQKVVLVGVGNLGRAVLAHCASRLPRLRIVAAFDEDDWKTGRVIKGCRCLPAGELEDVIAREGVRVGILTVPAPAAQETAERLLRAGIRGLVNFAPVRLRIPPDVFVQDMDMGVALERVAYFARPDDGRRDIAG